MSTVPTIETLAAMSDSAAQAIVNQIGFPPERAAYMRSHVTPQGHRVVTEEDIKEAASEWRANMIKGSRAKRAELAQSSAPTIAQPKGSPAPKAPRVMTTRLQVTLPVDVVQIALDLHDRGLLIDLLRTQSPASPSVTTSAPLPAWLG